MIRVDSITIKEFRGIRDMTLDFKGKNFAICGKNGTGKSGVVDALEFALTGNVSRLAGEGRGDISLKQHGPHVDRRDDPDKARVRVQLTIPSLGKTVTIERSLKTPTTAQASTNDPAVLGVLQYVKLHPEIVLSRRELIRYVLATPGQRAEEVQALLHLDQVRQVRTGLNWIANNCERQLTPLGDVCKQAEDNLLRALEISELTKEKVLGVANAQRAHLGLPGLTELSPQTSLKDGMATPSVAVSRRIPKAQATADIQSIRATLAELTAATIPARVAEVTVELSELAADQTLAASVSRELFYATGIDLIDSESCPFCDSPWDMTELKNHIQRKTLHLKEAARKRASVEKALVPLINLLRNIELEIKTLTGYAAMVTPAVATEAARNYIRDIRNAIETLTALIPLTETIMSLGNLSGVPRGVFDFIEEIERVINTLPAPTKQDAARDWLTIAQERLEVWRAAKRTERDARERFQKAQQVSVIYAATSDAVLSTLYQTVAEDFASLYRFINQDDEDRFKAQLIPSLGKLGFDVDFYGRGFFPPGAYHSEGHQDGMGLCLYLALMRHLQGDGFTFAVLDDVLMSVDVGHRREVCALLKKEFPNTQFVMTTHDQIWLRHMKTEGLIGSQSAVQFRSWSVDHGPTQWDERDVWIEIGDHLNKNDVRAAAALLRHYLEYTSTELCHRLRAPVQFRGDAQYQLGELLPAATTRMRQLLNKGKDTANSWNQKDSVERLASRGADFGKLTDDSNVEKWQINIAVHYNSWDDLVKEDFAPLVKAFRDLLNEFTCLDCNAYLRVSPDRETPDSLRCDCGKVDINLRKKGA